MTEFDLWPLADIGTPGIPLGTLGDLELDLATSIAVSEPQTDIWSSTKSNPDSIITSSNSFLSLSFLPLMTVTGDPVAAAAKSVPVPVPSRGHK